VQSTLHIASSTSHRVARLGCYSVNCWDTLRAAGTTTQPVKANVMVRKASGLGNQQPSAYGVGEGSTTRASARSGQATAKCGGTGSASSRYSLSCSETNRGRVAIVRNSTDVRSGTVHHVPDPEYFRDVNPNLGHERHRPHCALIRFKIKHLA